MPATLFDALPGLDAPLGAISKSLAAMWGETKAHGRPAPSTDDSKATQVNLVLHLGSRTTVDDGVEQFHTAVRFSRRYPSRVVVLCPSSTSKEAVEIHAKVYGECTVGKSKEDTRCCEFVLLTYSPGAKPFVEAQVSVCLSTDLPLYYWAHGFSTPGRLADYRYLLTRSKRVLFDSAIEPAETLSFPWPRPEAVRDLAYARLLPVRQSLGQFLSRYPMGKLCTGLQSATVTYGPDVAGEARVLLGWLRDRIGQCGDNRAVFAAVPAAGGSPAALGVEFKYAEAKLFSWQADLKVGHANFQADFGSGRTVLAASVSLLPPEIALSEAMFF